jgi:membrane-associated protease RseP (regulator of RpoE activity)
VGVLLFVLAILVVIMVHESGHFLVAKAFDFKATKFFLGFGPTLWSFTKGETEYGVKALPLGGFVKIAGMNPYEDIPVEDRPRSYPSKPRWQRALVLVAGSATHWLVVFVLLVPTLMFIGLPSSQGSNRLYSLQTKSPAASAGMRPGDRIVGVGGTATESWPRIRAFIRDHGGETVSFTVESEDGGRREVPVRLWWALYNQGGVPVDFAPRRGELQRQRPDEKVVGFLGVSPEPIYETSGLVEAVGGAARHTWAYTTLSVRGIGEVFGQVFDGRLWAALGGEGSRKPNEGPLGIVGASRIADESFARGQYLALIELVASFTIFVGLMNLLPLPPLDGGHLAVVAYEAVTKRRVDLRKLIPIAAAVISFFVLLFLAVLYLDLARPIKIPF